MKVKREPKTRTDLGIPMKVEIQSDSSGDLTIKRVPIVKNCADVNRSQFLHDVLVSEAAIHYLT